MQILAIETATPVGSVALVNEAGIIASYSWQVNSSHSEELMAAVGRILSSSAVKVLKLDGVAVSIGPGSFTGLRIGLSTAKGLCFANQIPLVAVSTLKALASRFPFCKYRVCPMLDARKKQVYTCLYDTSEGAIRGLFSPEAITPDEFLERLDEPTLFTGDGAFLYQKNIINRLNERAFFAPFHLAFPDAGAIGRLGILKLKKGQKTDAFSIEPTYIRGADVRVKS